MYKDYSGKRVVTLGYREIIVYVALPNSKTYSFITTRYYSPGGYRKLFGIQKLLEEQDISYDTRTRYLTDGKGDIVGYVDTSSSVLYLICPKDKDLNKVLSNSDSNLDKEDINTINKVIAYEVHRRLGYTGKARITSTL